MTLMRTVDFKHLCNDRVRAIVLCVELHPQYETALAYSSAFISPKGYNELISDMINTLHEHGGVMILRIDGDQLYTSDEYLDNEFTTPITDATEKLKVATKEEMVRVADVRRQAKESLFADKRQPTRKEVYQENWDKRRGYEQESARLMDCHRTRKADNWQWYQDTGHGLLKLIIEPHSPNLDFDWDRGNLLVCTPNGELHKKIPIIDVFNSNFTNKLVEQGIEKAKILESQKQEQYVDLDCYIQLTSNMRLSLQEHDMGSTEYRVNPKNFTVINNAVEGEPISLADLILKSEIGPEIKQIVIDDFLKSLSVESPSYKPQPEKTGQVFEDMTKCINTDKCTIILNTNQVEIADK